jgi:flagellar biosynthesis anti-sigma factor FlgM
LAVKIDPNLGITDAQPLDRVAGSGSAPVTRPSQASAPDTDQASLSSDALKLSNLSAALSNVPEIRQERVASLSQALQNGSYSVTDQQIAQAMIRDYQPNNANGG